jgi:hypothetical protein
MSVVRRVRMMAEPITAARIVAELGCSVRTAEKWLCVLVGKGELEVLPNRKGHVRVRRTGT